MTKSSYIIGKNKKTRIAILGDSFTEAFQIPQHKSFPKLLEQELNLNGQWFGHFLKPEIPVISRVRQTQQNQ